MFLNTIKCNYFGSAKCFDMCPTVSPAHNIMAIVNFSRCGWRISAVTEETAAALFRVKWIKFNIFSMVKSIQHCMKIKMLWDLSCFPVRCASCAQRYQWCRY